MAMDRERPKVPSDDTSFDYTKWRANLWPDVELEHLSHEAMKLREATKPK